VPEDTFFVFVAEKMLHSSILRMVFGAILDLVALGKVKKFKSINLQVLEV